MKRFSLFTLLAINFWACDQKNIEADKFPLIGSYSVTHLTQYEGFVKTFEGDLPATLGDTLTIKHYVSIDLPTLKSSNTEAFVNAGMSRFEGNRGVSTGINFGSVSLKASQGTHTFDFYYNGAVKLGTCNGKELTFDFIESDSLGRQIRYIYKATKTSARPREFQ